MDYQARTLASGFAFPEGPRWREGYLWFADQHDGLVRCLSPVGAVIEVFRLPGNPSGIGWLPDGDMLVVSMHERRLYRRTSGALVVHAELGVVHAHHSNDMVVDGQGRAYVGNIGFDFHGGEEVRSTAMALVLPDGTVELAADGLACPNGTVITPDGRTLIVAESLASRLTAFTIDEAGRLADRRVFAELAEAGVPDGICLDAEGGVWAALPYARAAVRVCQGGAITDRVPVEGALPYACMLGGDDRRDLYLCVAPDHDPAKTLELRGGRIDVARVAVPGAGWP
ncbi:MAG: SMP-30/gluconolactonase/LRE family protein [Gammaproteobacteria bacterium]|jgi:sugar lactone lactonase YvrE|nr:SMP-30/gluconolactonase/LRE family protein [Gammaproteobacteria bacterium]MBK6581868.1 SMP-30/gluconolactonase/LRE family protein [Gammaproteobacteria bacterium]MBK7169426.1 SMP-30/gluconolactonase/LRE family protein [Gammaproteobacteria bacterium]MBK7520703.1 SMP-30/gluconolactonase/LRE family protein [Gammaproteobacteria bacterium]MBK7728384.1 SMP-30/gluconolactonase/LRE family protein [Gammaproteobacteria bacterium]